MFQKILISLAPVALLSLVAAPAAAQPGPPTLEIRIAHSAPPKVRYEHRPARPDHDSVWATGYWHWEGARWDWVSGRWGRAENARYHWVAARYRHEGNVWRYEPPHWSNQKVVEGDEYHRWKEDHRHG